MKTLIERLRRYKRDRSGYAEYCHQAADEIDHLTLDLHTERAAVVALTATVAGLRESAALAAHYHAAELADVTAELEKARDDIRARDQEIVRVVLEAAAQAAGPEDSYQDEWFAAKADAVKRIRALEIES